MDLNEFIFRDDTAEVLGAEIDGEDFEAAEEAGGFVLAGKLGAAAVAGAMLGALHALGDAARHL
ncbi:hypothetical protein [Dongia sp. agr-C8]